MTTHNIPEKNIEEFRTILSRLRKTPRDTNRTVTPKNYKLIQKYEIEIFLNGLNVVFFPNYEIRVYDSKAYEKTNKV